MLDMSFSEIAVIGVVALVVLGPERLPKVARSAGQLFGRLQRYVATVKADINREMDTSELAKIKQEVQDAAKSFEQTIQQHASSVEKETTAISQDIERQTALLDVSGTPSPTQNAMLDAQAHGLNDSGSAVTITNGNTKLPLPPVATNQARTTTASASDYPMQASLDFGIEPVRARKPT